MLCDRRGLIISMISVFPLLDVLLMSELMFESTFSFPIIESVTFEFSIALTIKYKPCAVVY